MPGASPAYRWSRPFLRHQSTPTIGEPMAISAATPAPTMAAILAPGESFDPSGSRSGLLSAISPGVILTPIETP